VEAIGAAGDHAQLVVEAFDDAVGQALAHIGKDPIEVASDRAGGLDEGAELGA